MVHPVPEGKRCFPRITALTEFSITACREQRVQMTEACQRRDQLDVQPPAVRIQLQDIPRCQRRVIAPHLRQIAKQIRVLDIELELIDLISTETIHHLLQIGKRQHPAPRLIQKIPPAADVRRICDLHAFQHAAALCEDLAQGLHTVQDCRPIAPCNDDPVPVYVYLIFLRTACRRQRQENVPFPFFPSHDRTLDTGISSDAFLQDPGIDTAIFRQRSIDRDHRIPTDLIRVLSFFYFLWFWQQIHINSS